jgi:hypothetical protein
MVPKEEARKGGDRLMPLFIDHHRGVEGLTAEAVADAHRADAPNKEAAEAVHREAHGLMADEITEVEEGAV